MTDTEFQSVISSLVRQQRVSNTQVRRVQSTTTTVNNTYSTVGVVPTFITPVQFVTGATGSIAWTTYDASGDIPETAVAVIIQHRYVITAPDMGDTVADVYVREASGGDSYLVCSGNSSGASDSNAGGGNGIFPCANQAFDYTVESPGFDGGLDLWLVGYFG